MKLDNHIPEWTLRDDQLANHWEAVVQMNDNGPDLVHELVVNNNWFIATANLIEPAA